MAITNYDQLLTAMQAYPPIFWDKAIIGNLTGRCCTGWNGAGNLCGVGTYDTTLNGVTLTSPVNGQLLNIQNAPAGKSNYLANYGSWYNSSAEGPLVLADRLWHNGGYTITSTSAQNSTTPTWPARDNNGSTNGEGVLLALEISSTAGAATPTITVTYTNSDGTASRTGTNIDVQGLSSAATAAMFRISLQAGDKGVRSVQSLQLSTSWLSGTMNMVAYRPISYDGGANNSMFKVSSPLTTGLPKIHNDSVLYPWFFGNPSQAIYHIMTQIAQG